MDLLQQMIEQRDRITNAIDALSETKTESRGRPKGSGRKPGFKLSAGSRAKIASAAKARWRKAKKAGKNHL